MDRTLRDSDARRQLAEQAAEWLLRLEDATPREKREFVNWLKSSKHAPDEVLLAKSTDILLRQLLREGLIDLRDLPGGDDNVVGLDGVEGLDPTKTSAKHRMTRPARRATWLAAAGGGLAAAIATMFVGSALLRDWLHPNVYATSVGEQRAVQLADGSAISLNADSSLRVSYSEVARDVYLDAGQAMFAVAKDAARPFRVHVGTSVVQAVGTKFDIKRRDDRINVTVVEGTVQVSRQPGRSDSSTVLTMLDEATRVTAGQGVTVLTSGITAPTQIDLDVVNAWRQRRFVFKDNTLGEITEEFARFNRTPRFRIEGEALRARRFSGVFDADAPETLLTYLAADDTVAVDRRGDEVIITMARDAHSAPE